MCKKNSEEGHFIANVVKDSAHLALFLCKFDFFVICEYSN